MAREKSGVQKEEARKENKIEGEKAILKKGRL